MGDYFLQSPRLGFRCWRDTDLRLAVGLWGDPAVTRYIAAGGYTLHDVQARLQSEVDAQRTYRLQYWPIFLLATGEHIGCCGLRMRANQPEVPELGFHLVSRHWRRGYAFEAASRVIEHAFSLDGIQAIFAGHNPENAASRRLLSRLGFAYTGDQFYAPTGLRHPSYLLTRPTHVTAAVTFESGHARSL
jgi:ribosomal-protein-alanine N-acetyltransferase